MVTKKRKSNKKVKKGKPPGEISEEESYVDDPLGIAKPWDETHKEEK